MQFPLRAVATALLAASTVLSACSTPQPTVGVVDRLSAPYVEAQHQYRFAAKSPSLSGSERAAINSFLARHALRGGDAVIVTIPTSGSPKTDTQRVQTMHAVFARVPSRIRIGMDQSFSPYPTVRQQTGLIRVVRAKGVQVDCQPGVEDLGCANAINLAVMIHEPGDVLAPAETARTAPRWTPDQGE
ncbi:CpaD family pilus assembly lipoprotein [uncultured Pseudosulfitobacter sp.]|uniref:CpaD family pilus assembly lipoprotein n=1 Tax=uncultured Pseudosulfitobacter sp. TaxID=2854214 RepID=UPI0030D94D08